MPHSDDLEETFFDPRESFSSEESISRDNSSRDYRVWKNELQSIQQRRECFFRDMGFLELQSKQSPVTAGEIGVQQIVEISSAEEEEGMGDNDEAKIHLDQMHVSNLPSFHTNPRMQKLRSWWKRGRSELRTVNQMKVRQNSKRHMEFTALYIGQEIRAHHGCIWTMKFSPDGRYLATGGEDGVVRIWCVESSNTQNFSSASWNTVKQRRFPFLRKEEVEAAVVIPEKGFRVQEPPLQELYGHSSDVLDLAWSNHNCLLSSSMDKTVRRWRIGSEECVSIFQHKDYVTCIQYNPVNANYFISGSVDGKVRIWAVSYGRVVDWVDARYVITAISYQADGKGFVVGSVCGECRFYDRPGEDIVLDAKIRICGKKKASRNGITSIQLCSERPERILVTSSDSKVRVLDGMDVVCKYRGLRKSNRQTSAIFTSEGKHIISVAADSRVYIWNYDAWSNPNGTIRSCEHFSFDGISIAIPWSTSGAARDNAAVDNIGLRCSSQPIRYLPGASWRRDTETPPTATRIAGDALYSRSATWPEENLPDRGFSDLDWRLCSDFLRSPSPATYTAPTWGLVIVTASCDGTIRTFHNYGLPAKF